MIYQHSPIAVDISCVKAIWKEYLPKVGNLVFEFKNFLHSIDNPFTEEKELESFHNFPIIIHFKDSDSLRAYFDEWVEMWEGFKRAEV